MLQAPLQESNADSIYYKAFYHGIIDKKRLNEASVKKSKNVQSQAITNKILIAQAKKYKNISVIDPTDVFCNANTCPVGSTTTSYYFDDDHLSTDGSYKLKTPTRESTTIAISYFSCSYS